MTRHRHATTCHIEATTRVTWCRIFCVACCHYICEQMCVGTQSGRKGVTVSRCATQTCRYATHTCQRLGAVSRVKIPDQGTHGQAALAVAASQQRDDGGATRTSVQPLPAVLAVECACPLSLEPVAHPLSRQRGREPKLGGSARPLHIVLK